MGISPARGASEDVAKALDPDLASAELLRLAVHRSAQVRAAIASRSDCPVAALISLGHDHDQHVLRALIGNPRTPSSVVRNLADHRVTAISDAAVQRLRNSFR
ncbi:hypothetical protein [Demequina activiva]|uniref:Leucine rich repeat variant n=1 Tax=Demequina activiva TaxID=1582364 RepID=A0A919UKC3_9MICO|nr:hypothetical protein [Demequina activiva]GIG54805.1 hypothetical protein Dac01nite_15570 [Demequina activiva]